MYFTFENSLYLYLLFFIPLAVLLHFYLISSSKKASLKFANFEAIARIKGVSLYSKNLGELAIFILMIIAVSFFVSGLTLHKEVEASSFSYVIVIESSQSMGAVDLFPNRLEVAKKTSINFLDSLPSSSRAAIVSFSGNTIIEQRISENKFILENAIQSIELSEVGGTDVYEAVIISIGLLENEENKAIILLSDGQVNVGDIEEIFKSAREQNVIVHTIGVGTKEGGATRFGISKLDEDSLKALSYNTNGKFYFISSEEDLENAFDDIIELKPGIASINLSFYFGMIIVLLIFLHEVLSYRSKITL